MCRGGPLGKFFEQFGAVPAGPMTAYKLLKGNEQVVSTRILGQCAPSTHCVGGTTTLRLWLARLLVNLCTLCSASS